MIHMKKRKCKGPEAEVVHRHLRNKQGGQCCPLGYTDFKLKPKLTAYNNILLFLFLSHQSSLSYPVVVGSIQSSGQQWKPAKIFSELMGHLDHNLEHYLERVTQAWYEGQNRGLILSGKEVTEYDCRWYLWIITAKQYELQTFTTHISHNTYNIIKLFTLIRAHEIIFQ